MRGVARACLSAAGVAAASVALAQNERPVTFGVPLPLQPDAARVDAAPVTPVRGLAVGSGVTPAVLLQPPGGAKQPAAPTPAPAPVPAPQAVPPPVPPLAPFQAQPQPRAPGRRGGLASELPSLAALPSPKPMLGYFPGYYTAGTVSVYSNVSFRDPAGAVGSARLADQVTVNVPLLTRLGVAITDNESPRPQDRAFVTHNFYSQMPVLVRGATTIGSPALPRVPAATITLPELDVNLFTVGFERTFAAGRASVGVRLPFYGTNQRVTARIVPALAATGITGTTGGTGGGTGGGTPFIGGVPTVPPPVALPPIVPPVIPPVNPPVIPPVNPPIVPPVSPPPVVPPPVVPPPVAPPIVVPPVAPSPIVIRPAVVAGGAAAPVVSSAPVGAPVVVNPLGVGGDDVSVLGGSVLGVSGATDGWAVGDLSLVFKYALLDDVVTGDVLSAGVMLTLPTGHVIRPDDAFAARDVLFQPFVGYVVNFDRWYVHAFHAVAVATDPRDAAYLFNDVGVGYHLWQAPGRVVTGITPTVEVHVATPLSGRNPTGPVYATDTVALTSGLHVRFGRGGLLTAGVAVPLTGPRPFRAESLVRLNWYF